jgi:hypothetical protein
MTLQTQNARICFASVFHQEQKREKGATIRAQVARTYLVTAAWAATIVAFAASRGKVELVERFRGSAPE